MAGWDYVSQKQKTKRCLGALVASTGRGEELSHRPARSAPLASPEIRPPLSPLCWQCSQGAAPARVRGLTTSRRRCGRRSASEAAPPRCTARPQTRWNTPSRPSAAGTGCSGSLGPCTRSFERVKKKLFFLWRAGKASALFNRQWNSVGDTIL